MKKRTGTWLMACLLALLAGGLPQTKAASPPYAYVTNEKDNTLLAVDLDTAKIIKILLTGIIPTLWSLPRRVRAMSIIAVSIGQDRNGKKPIRIKHPFWSKDGRFV